MSTHAAQSPVTRLPLASTELTPDHAMKSRILRTLQVRARAVCVPRRVRSNLVDGIEHQTARILYLRFNVQSEGGTRSSRIIALLIIVSALTSPLNDVTRRAQLVTGQSKQAHADRGRTRQQRMRAVMLEKERERQVEMERRQLEALTQARAHLKDQVGRGGPWPLSPPLLTACVVLFSGAQGVGARRGGVS